MDLEINWANGLPSDVFHRVLESLELPNLLAVLCVCKDWNKSALDVRLWEEIHVPRYLACRLWDDEFVPLVYKARGQLRSLKVSGSGISVRGLLSIIQAQAAGPFMEELYLNHCCNLLASDVVGLIEAFALPPGPEALQARLGQMGRTASDSPQVSPNRPLPGSESSPSILADELRDLSITDSTLIAREDEGGCQSAVNGMCRAPSQGCSTHVGYLAVEGCSQLCPHTVEMLAARVSRMDVGVCVCARVEVLEKCKNKRCLGLCCRCSELYRDCGLECGSCSQPQDAHQALRVQVHQWNLADKGVLRNRWRDVRHGIIGQANPPI